MKHLCLRQIVSVALICSTFVALTACKTKESETSADTTPSTSETIVTITTPSTEQTTLPVIDGSLPTDNSQEVTWNESTLPNPVTLYATVSAGQFLRVRKGPDVKYDIAGTLIRGQAVTVVATAPNNWYRTEDGYYVSGKYLKTTQPT